MNGGHEIRRARFRQTVRELQQRSNVFEPSLTEACAPDLESWESLDAANHNYQRLFFRDGRLVGGCLIGDIKMQTRIIQLIQGRQVTAESERGKLLAA